ncbi:MutS-related protein [Spongiivirga citrea]|uniref:DNA mismatch repair protein MutS n=1 Tax=Spongiivirga citrea TaxID=1481457 RepID=A0A6M0CGP2_9FLAO|nr:DNA mismatch repair protein MutS [Spongiivirga citrea]NER17076.1 DNA mismatch repair protein MutS [Spongiivirga citrea]
MQSPTDFYNQQQQQFEESLRKTKKRLFSLSTIRLVVFLATITGVYFFFDQSRIATAIGIAGIILFLYLVSRFTDIKKKAAVEQALIQLNKDELTISSGDFYNRDTGKEFINPKHEFSNDIDLFGKGSFFQYVNRTGTFQGKNELVNLLTSNDIFKIEEKQKTIKELTTKPKWRQHFTALASTIKVQIKPKVILDWFANYRPFLSDVMAWIPFSFSTLSIVAIVLMFVGLMSFFQLLIWMFIGLGITGIYLKKINMLSLHTSEVKETFQQYSLLLTLIEKETFEAALLKEQQEKIRTEKKLASDIFKDFSKALDALDNRNNVFSAIFANGFFLWDIMQSYRIEKWISKYNTQVEAWFETVAFFDAYNSLSGLAFNHPHFSYPILGDDSSTINAEQLGHPMLSPVKRVDSDFEMDTTSFFIITGANMAGKSTFLRTVSYFIVMANCGLPVCAKNARYNPIKLITSMRTSDSLTDEASYFFSELSRLKFIKDSIQKDRYFIVLDEILKGTNSTDKAQGSRKFVERLVNLHATGIIATHDLSLCEIEKELPEIKNYYFDAEIINDELFFDYKLKKGVCQNMNASFLLKKMDIV